MRFCFLECSRCSSQHTSDLRGNFVLYGRWFVCWFSWKWIELLRHLPCSSTSVEESESLMNCCWSSQLESIEQRANRVRTGGFFLIQSKQSRSSFQGSMADERGTLAYDTAVLFYQGGIYEFLPCLEKDKNATCTSSFHVTWETKKESE